jgi:phosphatidylinositol alpha-1,6-mannosyltransferase
MGEVYADGGIQRFNRTFLTACARLDLACDVLALNDSEESRERWSAPASLNIRVFNRDKVRFALSILAAATFGGYSLVVIGHVNLLTLVVAALTSRSRRKLRVLLIAHGIEVWNSIHGRRRRGIRQIDTILCVSRYTARAIRAQAPELTDQHFTIFPNALSESWADECGPVAAGVGRRIFPGRFFLSVARLDRNDRYKGIVTVLEAFSMLEDPTAHYVIAGRGNDSEFLQRVAVRLNVADRVHFIGGISDGELAGLYRSCAAVVLPSGKEGFGIVYLEAMYFGAPVIAAQARGAVDVVQHESTGLLVPYGDAVALRQAMSRLLNDSILCDRIRIAASRTVSGDGSFTFHAYVRRLAEVFGVPPPAEVTDLAAATDPAAAPAATNRGPAMRAGGIRI